MASKYSNDSTSEDECEDMDDVRDEETSRDVYDVTASLTNSSDGRDVYETASESKKASGGQDVYDRDFNSDKEETITNEVEDEIRVAIIGRTGSGKSSLGNKIMMKNVFQSTMSPISVTDKTEIHSKKQNEIKIIVADTPGLFHTSMSEKQVKKQLIECVQLTLPGPHVFLYVIKIGRYSDEELISFNKFLDIFGPDIFNHTILVFTGKDYMREETIDMYVEKLPDDFQTIVAKCHERIIAFDNLVPDRDNQRQLDDLLSLIKTTQKENNDRIVRSDMVITKHGKIEDKIKWAADKVHLKWAIDIFFNLPSEDGVKE